jgi:uncharacterized damage-inducible protein DinB
MPLSLVDAIAAEFRLESATTRRLLARVPEDRLGWKPHERSMTLGRLAGHLAELPGWAKPVLQADELDLGAIPPEARGASATSAAALSELFERSVAAFVESAHDVPDARALEPWRLRRGERVLLETPRISALRGFVLNHHIHHRGQLSVYLRLLEVPLPPIYGPTADENPFA